MLGVRVDRTRAYVAGTYRDVFVIERFVIRVPLSNLSATHSLPTTIYFLHEGALRLAPAPRLSMSSQLNEQVQRLASRLRDLSRDHPENDTLRDATSLLSRIESVDSPARITAWQAIEADICTLRRQSVWIPNPEDEELLEHLRRSFRDTTRS